MNDDNLPNSGLDFVQSAIDAQMPAGIVIVCEMTGAGIKVTGSKHGKTHEVYLAARYTEFLDSDELVRDIAPRILELKDALNGVTPKKPGKKRKAKKKAKKRAPRVKAPEPVPPAGGE